MSRLGSCRVARLAIAAATLAAASASAAELLPIQPGMAVVSSRSGESPHVLALLDLRDPECDASAAFGRHWPLPVDHGELPNPTGDPANEWTAANLGTIYGIALDDAPNPNVYVTASTSYRGGGAGSGRVHRIDGTDGSIRLLAELPNESGAGLGNVAFDRAHRQLFVTNFEDGKIYRLDLEGSLLDSFDPFRPDTGEPGYASLDERVWGVAVREDRVYFGTWSEDRTRRRDTPNSVYSVALEPDGGAFAGVEELELRLPVGHGTFTQPIADLAFSRVGDLLVGERDMESDDSNDAHAATVREYFRGASGWVPTGNPMQVGGGTDAAGGVDYAECVPDDPCAAAGDHVLATGDRLVGNGSNAIHGLQVLPRRGGGPSLSYLVDFFTGKRGAGDVEFVRHPPCLPVVPPCEAEVLAEGDLRCGFPSVLIDASDSAVRRCDGAAEYRFLDPDGSVARDWGPGRELDAWTGGTWTVEARCSSDPDCRASAEVEVVLERPPPPFELQARELDECNGGILLEWETDPPGGWDGWAWGSNGPGSFTVFRSELSCGAARYGAPLATGLVEPRHLDGSARAGVGYHYVVLAEAGLPAQACPPGPERAAPSTAECLWLAADDARRRELPGEIGPALRVGKPRGLPLLDWTLASPPAPGEADAVLSSEEPEVLLLERSGLLDFRYEDDTAEPPLIFYKVLRHDECGTFSAD